jgi:biotin synthase
MKQTAIRHDWQLNEVVALFETPLNDLIFQAQTLHRCYFNPQEVQLSTLLNIKTGKCPEDCAYCPQSAHYDTGLVTEKLLPVLEVIEAAQQAKQQGATRFCMGAAWRQPKERDFPQLLEIINGIKALEMECCMTLGMLSEQQAMQLKSAGLDYYNHNLDTSERFYAQIISTRDYQERLTTLENVRKASLKVCCGGIIGMGETIEDRSSLLVTLANLPQHPDSVPINQLIRIAGTPLEDAETLDSFEIVKAIAIARIMMPASRVRLSAGRAEMSDELQALCFLAGANSIFYGEKLLTADNTDTNHDQILLKRLGLKAC